MSVTYSETGFNISYSSNTTSADGMQTEYSKRNIGLPGPGIIIRLIRTTVIGQITT